ncbi:hypothetical protein ABIA33_007023, partial [Streptacidiphilus sp. MAP12-16]
GWSSSTGHHSESRAVRAQLTLDGHGTRRSAQLRDPVGSRQSVIAQQGFDQGFRDPLRR